MHGLTQEHKRHSTIGYDDGTRTVKWSVGWLEKKKNPKKRKKKK